MAKREAPSATTGTQTTEALDAFFSLWRRLIPADGMSLTAASTLGLLQRSGPLRLTVLAEREAVSQPAMTGLVDRLEGAGLVARDADPTDGRAVLIALTAKARALIEVRRARRACAMDDLLDQLDPDERAQLDAAIPALRRLIDHANHPNHGNHETRERQ